MVKSLVLFLLLASVATACLVPSDGMTLNSSAQLCTNVYYLDKGLLVQGENITLDCNGAVLKSWNGGKGITIEHSTNVTVKGCSIVSYKSAFQVRNASHILLTDNHLVKNLIGTRFIAVKDSATFNHDVSLQAPFEVLGSSNNALTLTNKPVEGDFCSENFCNEARNGVFLSVQPETDVPAMANWLFDQLTGRNALEKFRTYVFGNFV